MEAQIRLQNEYEASRRAYAGAAGHGHHGWVVGRGGASRQARHWSGGAIGRSRHNCFRRSGWTSCPARPHAISPPPPPGRKQRRQRTLRLAPARAGILHSPPQTTKNQFERISNIWDSIQQKQQREALFLMSPWPGGTPTTKTSGLRGSAKRKQSLLRIELQLTIHSIGIESASQPSSLSSSPESQNPLEVAAAVRNQNAEEALHKAQARLEECTAIYNLHHDKFDKICRALGIICDEELFEITVAGKVRVRANTKLRLASPGQREVECDEGHAGARWSAGERYPLQSWG